MKKTMLFSIFCLMAGCFVFNTVSAQIEWTPEQKEVWKTETTLIELGQKGDWKSFYQYFDDSYQEWPTVLPAPVSKEQAVEHRQYSANSGNKIEAVQKVPLQIWVHGDFAYTNYYIYSTQSDKSGKKERYMISKQDVLLKKDGKWLKVGSMQLAKPFN